MAACGKSGYYYFVRINVIFCRMLPQMRVVFQAVRVAVCGNMVSPPLGETMALVGCDDCLARIDRARTMAL